VIWIVYLEMIKGLVNRKPEIARRLEAVGVEVHHLMKSGQQLGEQLKIYKIHADKIRHTDC